MNATTNTIETAAGPVTTQPFTHALLKPGDYSAIIKGAEMARNHNGKLHLKLECDLGTRIVRHQMYCTTDKSTANTLKQIKNAFGIESFRDVAKIVEQPCSLRIEHEEYNGKTQTRVAYLNPEGSIPAADLNFDDLDAMAAAGAKKVEVDF